ncbi:MAG: hypothetical protein COT81_02180 [Candidatus Buchananbacteria bacterium CG10_big_fil_rev_8_21_14_0_10_42_9]|uniref:Uncharacterized protein n=1 Tax=Candidatus Buchananbacteria bacterium CG10_big_fil_rev_8_21_14_0_10_42_9 TaxID=1974526 RepID=A0A2H0W1M0_9BACT|nr:MAG: hypothetical protein COT81_02180 [Candidatus Buchananbacteria bacterium CG10_big_fil_rev_8_21_14_0_10_42_9]
MREKGEPKSIKPDEIESVTITSLSERIESAQTLDEIEDIIHEIDDQNRKNHLDNMYQAALAFERDDFALAKETFKRIIEQARVRAENWVSNKSNDELEALTGATEEESTVEGIPSFMVKDAAKKLLIEREKEKNE